MQPAGSQPSTADPRWEEVRRLLPIVERWLAAVGDLLGTDVDDETTSACPAEECDDRARLASLHASRSVARTSPHTPIEAIPCDTDQRARLRDVFEQFKACQSEITGPQWKVVVLLYHEGLTQAKAAKRLSKSPSAVSELHTRACNKLATHQRRLRKERFNLTQEHLNSPE